mmetsp:Transcript_18788/g.34000  ORF Transcript_18788/g.34000 Transcript_18788/m.34000 type:complete len:250 (-) Transcript_18788:120-869(-)
MARNIKTSVLVFFTVASSILAAPADKQAIMQQDGTVEINSIQQFQSQEAKTLKANAEKKAGNDAKAFLQHKNKHEAKSQKPEKSEGQGAEESEFETFVTRVVTQLLFGLLYYMVIVSKYPQLFAEPSPAAKKLQAVNEVSALCEVSVPICICSWLCSGPRAAHTFYSTGISDYWCSLLGMSLFPCCVLFVANSCTDLNEKLGGAKRDCLMSILCSFCCSCCVIAQDAESLDLSTGVRTGFCGVYQSRDL